jgi:rod shape determining protein RodA
MATLSAPTGYAIEGRRSVSRVDWPLLLSTALLLLVGLMSLYSVGSTGSGTFFKKQILYIAIGIAPFSLLTFVSPSAWRRGSGWLYAANIALLVAVFIVGKHTKGAERWILLPGGIQFQPSELAKLLCILTLASFYSNRLDSINRPSTFLLGLVHVGIPALLIWRQPHLGAALVILVAWFAISMVAGVPAKYLVSFCVALGIVFCTAMAVPSVRSKMLDSYQEKRINGIEAAKKDIQGRNWQTDRAEIAFGVGGVTGTGYLRGEQKQAGFIPEQHNDFIITVMGEEGGLVGCSLLLAAYGVFFYRVFLVMLNATEPLHKMMAAGVFAVLGFHTFVNIAMVLQLLPVVGLWLPFLSYGGTAVWLCMASVGLLLSIRRRQRPLLF